MEMEFVLIGYNIVSLTFLSEDHMPQLCHSYQLRKYLSRIYLNVMFQYIVRWALWFMRKQLIYTPKDLSKSQILGAFDCLLQQRGVEGLMFREHDLYTEKENFTHYTYVNNILFNFL